MNKIIIPQGEVFGRLTVVSEADNINGHTRWLCQCECGNQVTVYTSSLRSGNTQSCGCLQKNRVSETKTILIPEGTKFGRLTVVSRASSTGKRTEWNCICECGNQVVVTTDSLRGGKTQSCGCLQKERASEAKKTHGMTHSPEYNTWMSIKARCFNTKNQDFKYYGDRGITICDEWKDSFETFYADMGSRPEGCSIDRIDVDGNYEPSNCRWATDLEQAHNKRNNVIVTYENETKSVIKWSEELGIKHKVLRHRLDRGWSVEKAFNQPVRRSSNT
jgi:hypothetical protein